MRIIQLLVKKYEEYIAEVKKKIEAIKEEREKQDMINW